MHYQQHGVIVAFNDGTVKAGWRLEKARKGGAALSCNMNVGSAGLRNYTAFASMNYICVFQHTSRTARGLLTCPGSTQYLPDK